MKLLFDVGNTDIKIGLATQDNIVETFRLNTDSQKTADEYYISMSQLIKNTQITQVIIGSVVPKITESLVKLAQKYYKINPVIIAPGTKTGIRVNTDNPKEVGADIICAIAGLESEMPTLVVDLGTAIKYIYTESKIIKGVIIGAGLDLSISALKGGTALLPEVEIALPDKILGLNTVHAMQSAVTYGFAAQIDGLVTRIKEEVNNDFNLVLTGGYSRLIAPLCHYKNEVDTMLVLKGLLKILNKN